MKINNSTLLKIRKLLALILLAGSVLLILLEFAIYKQCRITYYVAPLLAIIVLFMSRDTRSREAEK